MCDYLSFIYVFFGVFWPFQVMGHMTSLTTLAWWIWLANVTWREMSWQRCCTHIWGWAQSCYHVACYLGWSSDILSSHESLLSSHLKFWLSFWYFLKFGLLAFFFFGSPTEVFQRDVLTWSFLLLKAPTAVYRVLWLIWACMEKTSNFTDSSFTQSVRYSF